MSYPPVRTVALLRGQVERLLTDTCAIQTYAAVRDSEGGQADTWSETQSDVPCRVSPSGLTPAERVIAERLAAERLYAVTLPATVAISERDRIVWDGQTLEVVSVALRTDQIVGRVLAEMKG